MVDSDSVIFFPTLKIFLGKCTTYHGTPVVVAVGLDSDGVLYLLDSYQSLQFLEERLGLPTIDSSNALAYGFEAARLANEIPWNATLVSDSSPAPDPRGRIPPLKVIGDCSRVQAPWIKITDRTWQVAFDAATELWLGRASVFLFGGHSVVTAEIKCSAVE